MNNIFTWGAKAHVFSRDQDGNLVVTKEESLRPYFYVPDETGQHVSIFGDKCRKVCTRVPSDVGKQRDDYPKHFEADIHYPQRCLIDLLLDKEPDFSEPLRYQFIDIELLTDGSPLGNIKTIIKTTPLEIASIGVYDSQVGYRVFCWRAGESFETDGIKCFETESEMADAYAQFLKENFPDVIVGWNASRFDFPYLLRRFGTTYTNAVGELTTRWQEASPIGFFMFTEEKDEEEDVSKEKKEGKRPLNEWRFGGLSFLDYMDMYKSVVSVAGTGLDSYALDAVGEKELGIKKIEFDTKNVLAQPLQKLIEYNLRDVEIMVKLEEKRGIIRFFNQVRKIARCEFESVLNASRMVDSLMLHYAKRNGFVLPSKVKGIVHEEFEGAYIKQPEPGLYDWVAVFDFASLYPNIMMTFNISPEMLTTDPSNAVGVNGVYFKQTGVGLYPMVCRDFMIARDKLKKEMKKHKVGSPEHLRMEAEYAALKAMTNSIYGYSAFKGSRLYSQEVGSSITYIGRTMLKHIEATSGIDILYADTDSVFVRLKSTTKEDAMKEVALLTKKLKKVIDEFIAGFGLKKHSFEMQFDKLYRRLFIGSKKRYVGWLMWKGVECDSVETRGYETRRSDTPVLAKKFLAKFFERLVKGATKGELDGLIEQFKEEIRKSPPSAIGFPVTTKDPSSYTKDVVPMHVRALNNSIKLGILDENVYGDKVKYTFVVEAGKHTGVDVLSFSDDKGFPPKGFRIDHERVIKRLVDMKIEPIYDVLFSPKRATLW